MPSWDPNQYLKFTDHRLRPALDLLAQIPAADPRSIYDLGCGPGNITRLLAERWPGARVVGVDSSADMLAKARQEAPGVAFEQADIAHANPRRQLEAVEIGTVRCDSRLGAGGPETDLLPAGAEGE